MCNVITMDIPAWVMLGIGVLVLIGSALSTYSAYLRKEIAALQKEHK